MKKIKPIRTLVWAFVFVLPFLIFSCYPDGPSATEDLDLVGTMHDPEFSFQAAATFSLPDTVIHIIGEDQEPEDVDHSFDELMLSTVKTNMDALGYAFMEFDTVNPADVVLLISAVSSTNAGLVYDPGWFWGYWGYWPGWGGYFPGFGPGWGYGYPWGYPIYYSYSTGSVFVTMVNPEEYDVENETIGVVWMAAMNGLLQDNKSQSETRIREGINQAFKQDEQLLKTN